MAETATPYRPVGNVHLPQDLRPYDGPWTERQAAHVARRAGFGVSPAALQRLCSLTMHEAVASYLRIPTDDPGPSGPDNLEDPREIMSGPMMSADKAELQRARNEVYRRDLIALQLWWLNLMLSSPNPLQEKLTLFWHGHFTSAYREKGIRPTAILTQNQLFRRHALGNIRDLTVAVSQDPAMLLYLDNARSNKSHPNENYARELMELFTLGIGNYSEQDIRESARAFTGWGLNHDGDFQVFPGRHDNGEKTFLGQTGNFDGYDIVRIIFEQPACAKFFATKILEFFVYDQPENQLIDAVAELLRRHQYDLAPVMAVVLQSSLFYSDRAYRALVKSPVEFVLGAYQVFGITKAAQSCLGILNRSGQVLFRPPNVKGWDGGAAWLNSQTILTRENFAAALIRAPELRERTSIINTIPVDADLAAKQIASIVLQSDISAAAMAQLVQYLNGGDSSADHMLSLENHAERTRGAFYLAMAMPAYQLN